VPQQADPPLCEIREQLVDALKAIEAYARRHGSFFTALFERALLRLDAEEPLSDTAYPDIAGNGVFARSNADPWRKCKQPPPSSEDRDRGSTRCRDPDRIGATTAMYHAG